MDRGVIESNIKPLWPSHCENFVGQIGICHPIVQAPMAGGISTPELVIEVSNSGGLGSLGAGYLTPETLRTQVQQIKLGTYNPFMVNIFVPPRSEQDQESLIQMYAAYERLYQEYGIQIPTFEEIAQMCFPDPIAQLDTLINEDVPIISFTFGIPNTNVIHEINARGITTMATATSVEEALQIERAGIQVVIAQGEEAGGHRGGWLSTKEMTPTFDLLTSIKNRSTIPVIAAGGISNGEQIAELLEAGAEGVSLGTAFIVCPESGAEPAYRTALLSSIRTAVTDKVTGRYARFLDNPFIMQVEAFLAGHETPSPGTHYASSKLRKNISSTGVGAYFAGSNHHMSRAISASELMRVLVNETQSSLSK